MNQNTKSFEENMKRLEQIIRAMEHGDVALEESLKLFQEGTGLVQTCGELLERCQFDLLVDCEDVMLLVKRNVDEEWVHQMMRDKYGYNNYELIFQDTIYGEKIFFYSMKDGI